MPTIQHKIYEVRGRWVILDRDLAELYGVTTSALNQAVKRNIKRFPPDFMFQLTETEYSNLKSHFVTSSWGGVRKMPNAFTEQGVAMLSGLLNSDIAINANITIMRAFVAMRNYITTSTQVTAELAEIRAKLELLERNDEDNLEAVNDLSEDMRKEIDNLYQAIAELSLKSVEVEKPRRKIGFINMTSNLRINQKYRLEFTVREILGEEIVTFCRLLEISKIGYGKEKDLCTARVFAVRT